MEYQFEIFELKEFKEYEQTDLCFLKFMSINPISSLLYQTKTYKFNQIISFSEKFSIIVPISTQFIIELWNNSPDKGKYLIDKFKINEDIKYDNNLTLDSEQFKYKLTMKINKPVIAENIETQKFENHHLSNILISIFSKNELDFSIFHSSQDKHILEVSNGLCNIIRKSVWESSQIEDIFVYTILLDLRNIFHVWNSLFLAIFPSLSENQSVTVLITQIINYFQTTSFSYVYFSHNLNIKPKTLHFPISLSFIPKNQDNDEKIEIYDRRIDFPLEEYQLLYQNMDKIKISLHFPQDFETNKISSNPFFTITKENVLISLNILYEEDLDFSLSVAQENTTKIEDVCCHNKPNLFGKTISYSTNEKSVLCKQSVRIDFGRLKPKINFMPVCITSFKGTPISKCSNPILTIYFNDNTISYSIPSINSPGVIVGYFEKVDNKWKFTFKPTISQYYNPFSIQKDALTLFKGSIQEKFVVVIE